MRKRYLFLATTVALIGLMVVPTTVLAGKRIQDEGRGTVSLDSDGNAPEQATGVATFNLDTNDDGWYRVQMKLSVRSLPARAGRIFETWWRDSETGFEDPVGAFQTSRDGGKGGFTVTKRVNFFAPFDEILVTSERRNDSDPKRNGPVLLRGVMK